MFVEQRRQIAGADFHPPRHCGYRQFFLNMFLNILLGAADNGIFAAEYRLRRFHRQLAGLLGHDAVEDVDQTLAEMQGAEMQGAAMQEGALPFPAGAQ